MEHNGTAPAPGMLLDAPIDRALAQVLIVEDDPVALNSLVFLLDSVGLKSRAFNTAEAFFSGYDPEVPGCVVVDARLPDISGLELQERLRARQDPRPVILVSGFGDVQMVVRAMKAGAMDFLEKPFNAQMLLERVELALKTDARGRIDKLGKQDAERRISLLTLREAQVVRQVVDGKANKEIARSMGISRKTVELHRAKAMRKLGAHHVSDMVRMYMLGVAGAAS